MKIQRQNKILSAVLAIVMLFGLFPLSIFAGEGETMPAPDSYYMMDEIFDGAILDHGTKAHNMPIVTNDGSVNVRPSYPGEVFANGYSPQKNYNYAAHAGTTDYALNLSRTFSVTVWFKAQQDNTVNQVLAADCPMDGSAAKWKIYIATDNKIHFQWNNGDTSHETVIHLVDYFDKWTQVAFTYDGTHVRAYMNGTINNGEAIPDNMKYQSYQNQRLMIGNDGAQTSPFKGGLAEIKMYDGIVLTDAQIAKDAEAHTPEEPVQPDDTKLPAPDSYYKMDEIFDGAILDHGTKAHNMPIVTNDGSANVRPSYPGEIFENGYSPQKNYNYALHAGTTDYALHLYQNFSVTIWFKAIEDSTVDQVIASDGSYDPANSKWSIYIGTDSKIHFVWNKDGKTTDLIISKTDYFDKWTQVAYTFDGTQIRAYINGVLDSSVQVADDMKYSAYQNERLMIGNNLYQESPFKGGLAEIKMYDGVVLTDAQVALDKANHTPVVPPVDPSEPNKLYEWMLDGGKDETDDGKLIGANTGVAENGDMDINSVSNWKEDTQWGTNLTTRTVFSPIGAAGANYATANIGSFSPLNSFNISFWLKADQKQSNDFIMLMSDDDGTGKHTWDIHFSKNAQLKFQIWDCDTSTEHLGYIVNSTAVNDGLWHHVSFNYDAATSEIQGFYDGKATPKAKVSETAKRHLASASDTLILGNRAAKDLKLDGSMANVRFYNYTLDEKGTDPDHAIDAMIQADGGLSVLEPETLEELKHFWKFDEITKDNAVVDYGTGSSPISGNIIPSNLIEDDSFTENGYTYRPGPYAISGPYSMNMMKSFTVSGWFKPSGLGTEQVIMGDAPNSIDGTVPANWQVRLTNTGSVFFQWGQKESYGLDLNTTVTNNGWQHIAFTYDSESNRLTGYLDGEEKGSMMIDRSASEINYETLGQRFMFGNNLMQGKLFRGRIHNIRVYSYAQTKDEINIDWNTDAPNGIPEPDDLVPLIKEHEWKLNESAEDPTYGLVTWDRAGGANIVVTDPSEYKEDSVFGHTYQPSKNGSVLTATKGAAGNGYSFDMMEPFVISAWINTKQAVNKELQTIVADAPYEEKCSWALRINKYGQLSFQMGIDPDYAIVIKDTTFYNAWTNVTITFDGVETLRAYMDGVKKAELIVDPVKPRQQSSKDRVMIANSVEQVEWLKGRINNVRLYSGTMDDQEVMEKIVQADILEYPDLADGMKNKAAFIPPDDLYDEDIDHDMDDIDDDVIDDDGDDIDIGPEVPDGPESVIDQPDIDNTADVGTATDDDIVFDEVDDEVNSKPDGNSSSTVNESDIKVSAPRKNNDTLLWVAIGSGFAVLAALFGLLIALVIRKKRNEG